MIAKTKTTPTLILVKKDFAPYKRQLLRKDVISNLTKTEGNPIVELLAKGIAFILKYANKLFDKIKLEKDDFYHFVLFLQKQKNENKINTIDNYLCEQTLNYDISDNIIKLETVNEDLLDFYKKHYETTPKNNIQIFVGKLEFKPTQENICPKPEYFYNQEIQSIALFVFWLIYVSPSNFYRKLLTFNNF